MIASNLQNIQHKISEVISKLSINRPITLVAVSKKKPIEAIKTAFECGQLDFGENYFQEIRDKAPQLSPEIRWHFIGHLQSGKCRQIVKIPNLYMVHTVDTAKLANTLNKACENIQRTLKVLVQVNTSGEQNKSGCEPDECSKLVKHVIEECKQLEFCGLMTIGDFNEVPNDECFVKLRDCRKIVSKDLNIPEERMKLSMGMSNDFELAIESGSSIVRVGSSIFGARI